MKARLSTDGGARGNPGPAAYAYVLEAEDGTVLDARGARVLMHEANDVGESSNGDIHSASGEAARIAAAAGVDRLVLVHVHPTTSSDDELLRFARPRFAETVVGRDRLVL